MEGTARFAGGIVNLKGQNVFPISNHVGANSIQAYIYAYPVSAAIHQVGRHRKGDSEQTCRRRRLIFVGSYKHSLTMLVVDPGNQAQSGTSRELPALKL